ncbi:unnamed protein product [Symbiodinium natans]|uniref:Uncharacterized protein n=1 Tax=Symbiodinium natans TaxID=878477 RepID=A0A812M2C9_9DINO|nr:unnamed protein product [Symbiodinium natans]
MRLFGIPKREEGEPLEAPEPQTQDSARSARSGESPSQSSNGGDNQSFGQMKLVIKNTFIGGYEENQDEDPPRTLARSASDSKLDCTSSASSVLFWYPQHPGLDFSPDTCQPDFIELLTCARDMKKGGREGETGREGQRGREGERERGRDGIGREEERERGEEDRGGRREGGGRRREGER